MLGQVTDTINRPATEAIEPAGGMGSGHEETATNFEYPLELAEGGVHIGRIQMLKKLACDDGIEALVIDGNLGGEAENGLIVDCGERFEAVFDAVESVDEEIGSKFFEAGASATVRATDIEHAPRIGWQMTGELGIAFRCEWICGGTLLFLILGFVDFSAGHGEAR